MVSAIVLGIDLGAAANGRLQIGGRAALPSTDGRSANHTSQTFPRSMVDVGGIWMEMVYTARPSRRGIRAPLTVWADSVAAGGRAAGAIGHHLRHNSFAASKGRKHGQDSRVGVRSAAMRHKVRAPPRAAPAGSRHAALPASGVGRRERSPPHAEPGGLGILGGVVRIGVRTHNGQRWMAEDSRHHDRGAIDGQRRASAAAGVALFFRRCAEAAWNARQVRRWRGPPQPRARPAAHSAPARICALVPAGP